MIPDKKIKATNMGVERVLRDTKCNDSVIAFENNTEPSIADYL